MKYKSLGNSNINVSSICLGTMTFGQQNSIEEAFEQLDYALDQGVNFIDTAEMYPVPAFAEVQGRTEEYIGQWIQKRNNRDKYILASKITGPNRDFEEFIRKPLCFNKEQINDALNSSLRKLNTDYLDLYQLHWPERKVNMFGQRGLEDIHNDKWTDNILEILQVLSEKVKEGKIRHIGLSNETSWGVMRFLQEAKEDLPKIVSIQNAYSLLNRTYEMGLSEISLRENVGLLAYSPMAFGLLSGKYHDGSDTENARLSLYPNFQRYGADSTDMACQRYFELAKDFGLKPSQLALAFVNQRSFVNSTIIGATNLEQLKDNIDSVNIDLSPEILSEINLIHSSIPNPAP